MKIVCISDTHNLHSRLVVPDGDVLIHAGDATMRGRVHEVADFLNWMEALPHKYKIFVPGNHDFLFDNHSSTDHTLAKPLLAKYPSITYLKNDMTTIDGYTFYGTPWIRGFAGWAFGWKSDDGREAEFKAIPADIDILISHGPAFGRMDLLHQMRLGDTVLAERIKELTNLKYHIHGHVHYSYGVSMPSESGLVTVNAAICDESYSPVNKPIVIEL